MSVLVYVENTDGKFKKSTFEVVSYAKAIADLTNDQLIAVSIGDVAGDDLSSLGKYGVSKVLNVSSDKLKNFINQAYASVIASVADEAGTNTVVMSNSFSGKGLAPRVAAKLKAALADGAVELPTVEGNTFKVKKTAFSGKAFAIAELVADKIVFALNPNSYQVQETGGTAEVEAYEAQIGEKDLATVIKEIVRATNKISL